MKNRTLPFIVDEVSKQYVGRRAEGGTEIKKNRRQRRQEARGNRRFIGNHKGVNLTVVGPYAYFRAIQRTPDGKSIHHYIPKTR